VVGKQDDLRTLVRVIQLDVAVGMWVLLGADCTSEELHASDPLSPIYRHICQGPAFNGKSRPHKFHTQQSVRERCSFTDSDLNRLHGLEDSRVVFSTVVERPNILADARVEHILRDLSSAEGSARIWLPSKALGTTAQLSSGAQIFISAVLYKQSRSLQPRPCLPEGIVEF